ncbi:uncharacterized protein LOC127708670 isoform X1 [Mytilus californianus]|uniref:uncharacterized protein LOC127708670 isoform X1 n=1 Tax=Mytilus californianus TaxID=6549 RepID=UPI002247F950|nr:uncharacterized protein LOC127708670 isoform X1 [Mytilus californianus]
MNVHTGLLVLLGCHMAASVCKQQCIYCSCEAEGNPCAEIWAENCNVFINSTVNITCQLNESYKEANSSTLYFESDNSKLENDHITVVNQTTAVLQHVVTVNDIQNNFYCRTTTHSSHRLWKIQFLYIDYSPQEIVNFSCIWEGMEAGSLQCFWEHPVKYRTPNFINVSFEWKSKSKNQFQNNCSKVLDKTRCDDITENIYGLNQFFRINVTNTKLHATKTTLIENRYPNDIRKLYAKPFKMENVTVLEKNKTVIQLKWDTKEKPRDGNNKPRMEYTIKYILENGTRTVNTFHRSLLIQDLQIYTLYKFEVFAHYTDIFTHTKPIGLPSDSVYLQARTAQYVGKFPPRVTVGAIEYAEKAHSKVRNITVYWQNFNEMEENGPIVEFLVILETIGDEPIAHGIASSNASQHTFTNIQSVKNGSVRIKAGTTFGMSDPSNPVYIQKVDTLQPPEFLLEKKLNTDILISWQDRNIGGVKNYTIYWCERTNGCEKQIQWKTISVDETSYTVDNLDTEKNYLFGVSMDRENGSTGFSWKSCYYIRNEVPQKPNSVNVQNHDQQSITVVWTRPGTCERSPFVKFYILYWCQLAEIGDECIFGTNTSTRVNTSITEVQMKYIIRNLRSGTRYVVWLMAVSSDGKQSAEGTKNYNVTTMDPLQPETSFKYLGAAIGIPLVLILLVIFILAAQIRFDLCGKIKEMSKPFDIDVPTINRNEKSGMYRPCTLKLGLNGQDNKSLDISSEENRNQVPTISESVDSEEQTSFSFHSPTFTTDEINLNTNQHAETGYCSRNDIAEIDNLNTSIQHQNSLSIPDDSAPEYSASSLFPLFPVSCLSSLLMTKHESPEKSNQRPKDILEGSASSSLNDFEKISKHLSHPSFTTQNNEIQLELDSSEEENQGDNKGDDIQNKHPATVSSNSGYVSNKCFPVNTPDLLSSGIGTCSPLDSVNCSTENILASQLNSSSVLTSGYITHLPLQIYPGSCLPNDSLVGGLKSYSSSESMECLDERSCPTKRIDGKTSINIVEDLDYSVLRNHPLSSLDESLSVTPPILIRKNNNCSLSCEDNATNVHIPIHSIKNNLANDFIHLMPDGKINNGSQIMPECIHPATNNPNNDAEVVQETSSNKNDNDIINASTNNNKDGYVCHHDLEKHLSGGYGNNLCDDNVLGEIT